MTTHRTVKRIGGSLAVILPRDVAEMMSVKDGSAIRLTLIGRQLVVEPEDDTLSHDEFHRAFAAVLRRESRAFQAIADFDSEPGQRPRHRDRDR